MGSPAASLALVGALCLVALGLGAAAWLVWGSQPEPTGLVPTPTVLATQSALPTRDPLEPLTIDSIQRGEHLVFQNVVRSDDYAETSLVPLDSPAGMRLATGLVCERVHFASGHGICLTGEHDAVSRYFATTFDAAFQPTGRIELDGAPTFTRVSPDGRLAAASFQTSPPTAQLPFAPTETWILDTLNGNVIADLSSFALQRDGVEVTEQEIDHWGVTFKGDGNGFFATVRFGGNIFLAEGSLEENRLSVLQAGISAPSLSPDQSRLAFARLVSNIGPTWRFHVLDLASGTMTELPESKSIDDQMEWMGDSDLLYGFATDIWMIAADGGSSPLPFLFGGLSPAVVNPL